MEVIPSKIVRPGAHNIDQGRSTPGELQARWRGAGSREAGLRHGLIVIENKLNFGHETNKK